MTNEMTTRTITGDMTLKKWPLISLDQDHSEDKRQTDRHGPLVPLVIVVVVVAGS